MNDTLWGVVIGAASTSGTALLGALTNYMLARFVRREERAEAQRIATEARLLTEENRLREMYKRALHAAADYRMLSDLSDMATQWREFVPRLHELRAEFILLASAPASAAFDKYITHVDEATHAAMISNEPDDGYWGIVDSNLKELEGILREELKDLRVVPGVSRRLAEGSKPVKLIGGKGR
jgi:hypothetical protein